MPRRTAPAALLLLPMMLWAAGGGEAQRARPGGMLAIGTQPLTNLDPHFATSVADIQLLEQVYEHLTYIGASNRPVPDLANSWESTDGRTWTFALREGARFSSGKLVTASGVVASFNRLRDPRLGTPAAALYGNIREVQAVDARRVRFLLAEANPEFASDVGDYHAAILPAGSAEQRIGSGPFRIESYIPDRLVVLKRNPYYSRKDASGASLPYLEDIQLILSPEPGGRQPGAPGPEAGYQPPGPGRRHPARAGLGRKRLHTGGPGLRQVLPGAPAVRQPGQGARPAGRSGVSRRPGNHPARPETGGGAVDRRRLDGAAGPHRGGGPPARDCLRAILRRRERGLAEGGFRHHRLGARATPVSYFKLGYATGAPWNETHWSDPAFDQLIARIDREMNEGRRVGLYHRAQEILIERGPLIVPYFAKAAAGIRSELQGISLASDWPRTRFRDAWFAR